MVALEFKVAHPKNIQYVDTGMKSTCFNLLFVTMKCQHFRGIQVVVSMILCMMTCWPLSVEDLEDALDHMQDTPWSNPTEPGYVQIQLFVEVYLKLNYWIYFGFIDLKWIYSL